MDNLLKRLDEIGESLSHYNNTLALLALGSVGVERDRMDEFSDLDFFVICETGTKQRFIVQLDWLESIHPIAYSFQNTKDGYKLLYSDGIFCEFAVFDVDELKNCSFSKGKVVWKREGFDEQLCEPKVQTKSIEKVDFLIGEALTNLYVGLGRYHRGEKCSAYYFIQNYAFSRVLDLISLIDKPQSNGEDIFSISRRFEQRYPSRADLLSSILLGYHNSIASARVILEFLDDHFEVNAHMKEKIVELIKRGE